LTREPLGWRQPWRLELPRVRAAVLTLPVVARRERAPQLLRPDARGGEPADPRLPAVLPRRRAHLGLVAERPRHRRYRLRARVAAHYRALEHPELGVSIAAGVYLHLE